MKYELAFKPRVRKDLKALSSENAARVLKKIQAMSNALLATLNISPMPRQNIAYASAITASSSRLKATLSSSIVSFTGARPTVNLMIKLHPEVLKKNGINEFVILPYDEFVALQNLLEDAQDLADLREAVRLEGNAPSISLEELKADLGL